MKRFWLDNEVLKHSKWKLRTWRWRIETRWGFSELDSAVILGSGGLQAFITFNVQVCCGFVSSTVAGVSPSIFLCCFLDDQHAFPAVRLEDNILGRKDFVAVFEPLDFGSGFAQLAGQDRLILFNGGIVLKFYCKIEVALCKQTPVTSSSKQS